MPLQRNTTPLNNLGLGALCAIGVVALGFYLSWWFTADRWQSPWLVLGLVVAVAYLAFQVVSHWLLFLLAGVRPDRSVLPRTPLTVDVLITVCGEDHVLVRRCLAGALAMRGEHRVWLLDDGNDPALKMMAQDMGAGYLTRDGRKDAKAGNLNCALTKTDGDILAIFDVDHVPLPGYLEATVGHFDDPAVGFVQVMLTFREDDENWVEQAAVHSSFGFYNPTSTGMDTLGSVTMMGSNSLIRRAALAAIGNYQPGLAEDLATSMALHCGGWRSVYVREPLAPGLAPPDLVAWFTQQFKWSRGVFEVLVASFPSTWWRMAWANRLAYGVRLTMYWLGPVVALHIFATLFVLLTGSAERMASYEAYLLHLAPLAICNTLIHGVALKRWLHPSLQARAMWKAVALIYATWPIYTLAWCMTLLRIPLAFRPTPKSPSGYLNLWWLAPQALTTVLLLISAFYRLAQPFSQGSVVVALAALALAVPQVIFFWQLFAFSEASVEAELGDTI